ncbi:hypothetical protein BGW42_006066 [Actinomortierella wolfii]|nr:hypothetical protein BGW42_006066 [Actinomortierella wolfii]
MASSPVNLKLLEPRLSYIVLMAYFTVMCALALWMCRRNFTRLRIFACTLTFFGLSIAIMGFLRAERLASPNWFWVWNFVGELLAVAGLTIAIVSVGNGFYPMSRNRSIYWAMAMGIIFIFITFSTINIGVYTAMKIVPRHIPYQEVMELRERVVKSNMATMEEIIAQRLDECARGRIRTCEVPEEGYNTWRQLSYLEREMFVRPVWWMYMSHQILMLFTCLWVVIYLFIPLVRNHRHGAVGRSVDGDSMAVGVWYLSTLITLAMIYGTIQIYYLTNIEVIYNESIQAFDLGVRCTIGPIFFIPAPRFLIEFYRRHFSALAKSGSNQDSRRGGRGPGSSVATNPRFDGQGSFVGPNFEIRPTTSFNAGNANVGGDPDLMVPQQAYLPNQSARGSFDVHYPTSGCGGDKDGGTMSGGGDGGGQYESSPLKRMYGSLKLFQGRNRGLSSESGRQFNQDYPGDRDVNDTRPPRPPRDQARNNNGNGNKERRPSKERPESTQRLTEEALTDDAAGSGQYFYTPTNYSSHSDYDPLNVAAVQSTPVMGLRAPPHDLSHSRHHPDLPSSPSGAADTGARDDMPQDWRASEVESSYQDKRDSQTTTSWEGGSFGGGPPANWKQQQRLSLDLLQGDSEERGRRIQRGSQHSSQATIPRHLRRSYTQSQLEEEAMRRNSSGSARFSNPLQEYAMSALGDGDKTESVSDMSQYQQQSQKRYSFGRRSSDITRSMLMRDSFDYDIAGRDSFIEIPRQGYGGFTTRDRVARLSTDSSRSRGDHSPGFFLHDTDPAKDYLPELQQSLVSHAVDPTYWTRGPDVGSARRPLSTLGRASPLDAAFQVNQDSGIASDPPSSPNTSAAVTTKSKLQHKTSRTLLGVVVGAGGSGSGGGKKKDAKEKEVSPTTDKKSAPKGRWWPGHRREASAGASYATFMNDSDIPPTPTTPAAATSATTLASSVAVSGAASSVSTKSRSNTKSNKGGSEAANKTSSSTGNSGIEPMTPTSSHHPLRGIEGAPIEELTKVSIQCPQMAEEAARLAEESLWAQYDYPDPYYDESTHRKFLKQKHLDGPGRVEDTLGTSLSSSSPTSAPSPPPMPSEARASIQLHAAQLESRGIKSSLEMPTSPLNLSGNSGAKAAGDESLPNSPSPASGKTSFGSFLSRTASGSKRLVPPKLKGRSLRSKSDSNTTGTGSSSQANAGSNSGSSSGGAGNRGSVDAKAFKPQTALPITTTRPNPLPTEEDPSLAYNRMMASTSLSPPPRQTNWMTRNRAASPQSGGSSGTTATASQSLGKGAAKSSTLSVDTVAANAVATTASTVSGSAASLSPQTTATITSPHATSSLTSPGSGSGHGSVPSTPGSPPLSPTAGSAGRRSESSDTSSRHGPRSLISTMANMDSRRYQQHQHGESSTGSPNKSRTSPQTDNLAQAYYYNKRAQQANSSNAGSAPVSQELPSANPVTSGGRDTIAPPLTPPMKADNASLVAKSGYSYYGNGSSQSSSESSTPRRGSPSPDPLEAVATVAHQSTTTYPTKSSSMSSPTMRSKSPSAAMIDIGRPISPPLHDRPRSSFSSSSSPPLKAAALFSTSDQPYNATVRPMSPPMTASSPSLGSDPGSSPTMSAATRVSSSSGVYPPQAAYMGSGSNAPSSSSYSSQPINRTSSLTNSVRQMADDAWTQAMVARAQNSVTSRS